MSCYNTSTIVSSTSGEKSHQKASLDDVFKVFHETYDASDMEILCTAYKNLSQYQEIALKALSIKSTNSLESVSFTNASVAVEEHLDTWYPIGMIFLTGLRILQAFLQDETVPEPGKRREILSSLVTYLLDKEITTALCHASDYKPESRLTMLVLNHLLLRVTPNTNCSLDKDVSWAFKCPDNCKYDLQDLNLETNDTSIGHYQVWHGRVDALIGRLSIVDLAVTVVDPEDKSENGSGSPEYRSSIEVKQDFVCSDKPHHQILSETIVFSLLQKRLNPSGMSLIPTIGISGTELVVYFYDHEKDVLLQSRGIPFKTKGVMQITAVLVAWLVVNYKYLSDGLTDCLNDAPKANFFVHCKDKEDIYKNHIKRGAVGEGESYFFDRWRFKNATFKTPACLADLADIVPSKKKKSD